MEYLEHLHKKDYATEDHTTLLLTCYVKIDQHDQEGKLKEFINSKDKAIDFDVAIKVCILLVKYWILDAAKRGQPRWLDVVAPDMRPNRYCQRC